MSYAPPGVGARTMSTRPGARARTPPPRSSSFMATSTLLAPDVRPAERPRAPERRTGERDRRHAPRDRRRGAHDPRPAPAQRPVGDRPAGLPDPRPRGDRPGGLRPDTG